MRKVAVMAGILAALLALAGCGVSNGPSKADVATVKERLADAPEGWTVISVHADDSATEGLSRHLSINAQHSGEVSTSDARAIMELVVAAVPEDARHMIKVWLLVQGGETKFPNLTTEFRELGLGDVAGDHEGAEIYGTRAEFAKGLEATS